MENEAAGRRGKGMNEIGRKKGCCITGSIECRAGALPLFLEAVGDLFPASGGHLPGRQFPVSLRVPLGGQLWVDRGKVIEARKDFPARTDRASAAQGRAAVNTLLPRMAVFVFPPRMTSASRGDGFRRQR